MAAVPGSSSENETCFDRAFNLADGADFFAVFLNDVQKIYVTNQGRANEHIRKRDQKSGNLCY